MFAQQKQLWPDPGTRRKVRRWHLSPSAHAAKLHEYLVFPHGDDVIKSWWLDFQANLEMSCEDRCEAAPSRPPSTRTAASSICTSPQLISEEIYIPAARAARRSHLNVNAELIAERGEALWWEEDLWCENAGGVSSARSPKTCPTPRPQSGLHRRTTWGE